MTILSICIPTFNRASYLQRLLARLAQELAGTDGQIEVVVSDNASTDDTARICASSPLGTVLRYVRQPRNIGAEANIQSVIRQARGTYAVYLADDDILLWPGIAEALALLDADPDATALYAPWTHVDLVRNRTGRQFYHQTGIATIPRCDYLHLARHILDNRIFSEIFICRTDIYRRIIPGRTDIAFWAFTAPCMLLAFGRLIYAPTPFYGSVTRHFDGDDRTQLGMTEVQRGWDRYRGGLEHLIGLARPQANAHDIAGLIASADVIVRDRMLVALRLRLTHGGDPLESLDLATRLRGLGCEADLPQPLDQIRSAAAIHALGHQIAPVVQGRRLVLAGAFPPEAVAFATSRCGLPVALHSPGRVDGNDIVLIAGNGAGLSPDLDIGAAAFAITEADLLARYP